MIYLVDIDGVLCNETLGDYKNSKPNYKNIKRANKLYDDGHTVKIFTGRGSATGIDWRDFTSEQLEGWGVKYHELILGKPVCDYIIDDKNISLKDWESNND
jgi:dTDP-glucose 4,6-dehydratase